MNRKEVTEIFGVMMLAFPSAELFKGGLEKLKPTIELWTSCTTDIDFWTGQQAAKELCKTSKYPPTIAEFREQAEQFMQRMTLYLDEVERRIKQGAYMLGSLDAYCDSIPQGDIVRAAIGDIGGPSCLIRRLSNGDEIWEFDPLRRAITQRLRQKTPLPGSDRMALSEGGE